MITLAEALSRSTVSVEEGGRLFLGIGRNLAYEAARTGELPTIKIGRRVRVPVAPLAQKVGLQTTFGKSAA